MWRVSLMATGISVFSSLFFIYLYDNGLLPFTRIVSVQVIPHNFGALYHNTSRSTLMVTVSASFGH
jgi:hypothetical protein